MAQHSDRIMEETLIVQSNLDRKFYRKLKVRMEGNWFFIIPIN